MILGVNLAPDRPANEKNAGSRLLVNFQSLLRSESMQPTTELMVMRAATYIRIQGINVSIVFSSQFKRLEMSLG